MKLSELARKGAEVMAERGHCKRVRMDFKGQVCFLGAMDYVLWEKNGRIPATHDLVASGPEGMPCAYGPDQVDQLSVAEVAGKILTERGYETPYLAASYDTRPVYFNNSANVTGEDVILLLKQTAERLEDEGR